MEARMAVATVCGTCTTPFSLNPPHANLEVAHSKTICWFLRNLFCVYSLLVVLDLLGILWVTLYEQVEKEIPRNDMVPVDLYL